MTGYKVFTATSTDYVLNPAKYAAAQEYQKVTARYEIRANCDWIGELEQAAVGGNATDGYILNVENMRERLCKNFDRDADGGVDASPFSATGVNWFNLLNVILNQGNQSSFTVLDSTKVQEDVDAYKANIINSVSGARSAVTETSTEVGIEAVLGSLDGHNSQVIAELIHNSSMYDILKGLKDKGAFVVNASGAMVLNPLIGEGMHLLDKNDELVFPVELSSVLGTGNEDVDVQTGNHTVEINIVFKQSLGTDATEGHEGMVTTSTDPTDPTPATDVNIE